MQGRLSRHGRRTEQTCDGSKSSRLEKQAHERLFALHRICSYLAMFPPNIAGYFINRFTEKGDTVFDPFCGRGTTPLEAILQGREAIGSDLNKLAIHLTKGKTRAPPV